MGRCAEGGVCARGRQMYDLRRADAAARSARKVGVRRKERRTEACGRGCNLQKLPRGYSHRAHPAYGRGRTGKPTLYEGERLHLRGIPQGAGRGERGAPPPQPRARMEARFELPEKIYLIKTPSLIWERCFYCAKYYFLLQYR